MALTWVSLFTNQSITLNDFTTDLRTRIDEDTEDAISNTQILRLIYEGLRDINFRTGLLPEYAEITPDGSASYPLPTGMTKLQEVIYIDSNNNYNFLSPTNLEEVGQNIENGVMSEYVRNGNNIQVFASNLTTGTLRVYGSRVPTLPVDGTDYIDLPQHYLELLFLWCEWKFWRRRRESDEAALSRDLYFSMSELVREEIFSQYMRDASFYGKES